MDRHGVIPGSPSTLRNTIDFRAAYERKNYNDYPRWDSVLGYVHLSGHRLRRFARQNSTDRRRNRRRVEWWLTIDTPVWIRDRTGHPNHQSTLPYFVGQNLPRRTAKASWTENGRFGTRGRNISRPADEVLKITPPKRQIEIPCRKSVDLPIRFAGMAGETPAGRRRKLKGEGSHVRNRGARPR